VVILNKALYGCIESAKLWYHELAGSLKTNAFKPNPRDICIFNKTTRNAQITIVVYVDLMMTSTDKSLVLCSRWNVLYSRSTVNSGPHPRNSFVPRMHMGLP
jgi:Reverse transcriptase (RNA-dependent DNA polymerase)